MKFYLSFILIIITFFSCKKDNKTAVNYAYIGGEIINPSTNYIVLSKDKTIIDTIKLDGRNRFHYKIKKLDEGMHTFRHGGEFQMILIEPEDSVLFRLNTLDFDESLVFSGHGDKKNNYLINDFLENEKEERHIVRLCQLNPETYQNHVDSIKARKIRDFNKLISKHEFSPLFEKIALSNINYSYYSNKEVYPFVHYGKNKAVILASLPSDFYDYRKDINYNDESLSSYHNYNSFLRHHFSNLSLETHDEHATTKSFNRKSLCYNLDRLQLIDSLVSNETIKNDLLFHFTMKYLSRSKNEEFNNAILQSYIDKSSNEDGKKMMTRYTKSINSLKEGADIPMVKLIDYNKNELDLSSLINQPTVITFWSNTYYEHFRESHYKLKELKEKYPEVRFLVINVDQYGVSKSKKILEGHQFDQTNEYQFKYPKEASEVFAVHPMTKTLIIDKQKKIVNSNTNIFSIYFEKQLLGLINR
ncbi:TlpA family protein disulfide reductase [Algibacter mikhailovii]|uniref:Thioredoxin domain-containing protein n=1 Tax=Algibacter mikhailovii TaxID=425498 RepID=A0A918QU35_9FLAO|nr:hypothetical protein [Algibacter mikhailovii]GGZ70950.1 hypothetical protein GCM10007028_05200 [Algibacter mikhailovii]